MRALALDIETSRIAIESGFARFLLWLEATRNVMLQLAFRSRCEHELDGRPSTVEGALLQGFAGSAAERLGVLATTCRSLVPKPQMR